MSYFLTLSGHLPLRQLQQQFVKRLSKTKRWQWFSLSAVILSCVVVWGIYRTNFLPGFWGLTNDEIAVVAIESDEEGQRNVTIKDPSKSFWDVLELLGVPLVLAILGAWFQKTQQEQSERIAKEQREQDGDETREEVLQLYFDRVSALLIDKNLMVLAAGKKKVDAVRAKGVLSALTEQEELLEVAIDIIQARTLSILRRFEQDSERKSSVIRFLIEADIIERLEISFSTTNLSHVDLRDANLSNVSLNNADLIGAYLKGSRLVGANLRGSYLHRANLSRANLSDANLYGANLPSANLTRAILRNANMSEANLLGADLGGADLGGANLKGAYLKDADLTRADLSEANLNGAILSAATVIRTRFGAGLGLSNEAKQYLIQRGAIFDTEGKEQPLIPNESE